MVTVRRAWPVVLWVSLLPFAGWAAVRLLGAERGAPLMQLMSFTPYAAGATLVPFAAALLTRRWWQAAAAGALVAVLAGCVLPRAVTGPPTPSGSSGSAGPQWADAGGAATGGAGRPVRVLTANLLFGQADPATLLGIVREHQVDVLAVQELTGSAAAALDAAGLLALLPHRSLYPAPGGGGSGLFSRYPLRDVGVRRMPAGHLQAYGTLAVPGARPVLLESVHPCAPSDVRSTDQWSREIALQPRATPSGPVRVLLGDFNSTLDHSGLRRLISSGYTDAASAAGAGLRPTWSPGLFGGFSQLVPPVAIDHVLVDRRVGVRAVAVHPLPGSDHRAVFADLAFPAAPA
jgi:endonuclease/exonuclease/phosphatase family metal-dependent hydrolase